jgi:hypothetical protein
MISDELMSDKSGIWTTGKAEGGNINETHTIRLELAFVSFFQL